MGATPSLYLLVFDVLYLEYLHYKIQQMEKIYSLGAVHTQFRAEEKPEVESW